MRSGPQSRHNAVGVNEIQLLQKLTISFTQVVADQYDDNQYPLMVTLLLEQAVFQLTTWKHR
jgi:hypothetical protein